MQNVYDMVHVIVCKCTCCGGPAAAHPTTAKHKHVKSCRAVQVDGNAFTRKQGLFILEHAVRGLVGPSEQAWQATLRLLALLEDFALHLIKVNISSFTTPCDQLSYCTSLAICFLACFSFCQASETDSM